MTKKTKNLIAKMQGILQQGTLKILCITLLLLLSTAGCNKISLIDELKNDPTNGKETTLLGTKWKLVGIVDVETKDIRILEPIDCEKCYTLNFDTDSTFFSYTATNSLRVIFDINYQTFSIKIHNIDGTKVHPYFDEELFNNTLYAIQSFSLREKELLLYFDNSKKYLLYNQLLQ